MRPTPITYTKTTSFALEVRSSITKKLKLKTHYSKQPTIQLSKTLRYFHYPRVCFRWELVNFLRHSSTEAHKIPPLYFGKRIWEINYYGWFHGKPFC